MEEMQNPMKVSEGVGGKRLLFMHIATMTCRSGLAPAKQGDSPYFSP
jgi:hypothetical protein